MKNSFLKLIILVLVLTFLTSYIISQNGYYEYTLNKQTTITNEKIKEFELAIQNGENISEWEYFSEEEIDYTNRFSDLIYHISNNSNKLFRKYLKKLFQKLGEAVMEEE